MSQEKLKEAMAEFDRLAESRDPLDTYKATTAACCMSGSAA